MKQNLTLLILLVILACSVSVFSQSGNRGLLRFDGFYETKCYREKDDDEDGQDYLRFYANGQVISTATDCDTTENTMNEWFNPTAQYINVGEYRLTKRKLVFWTKGPVSMIRYRGRIKKNLSLKLKWKNADGVRGRDRYQFLFVPNLKVLLHIAAV